MVKNLENRVTLHNNYSLLIYLTTLKIVKNSVSKLLFMEERYCFPVFLAKMTESLFFQQI